MSEVSTHEARAQAAILKVLLMRGLSKKEVRLINTMSEQNLRSLIDKSFTGMTGREIIESFIVGVVFQHRNEGCVPQWMSDEFRDQLRNLDKELCVEIDTTPRKLNAYVLPKNMNDSNIQKNAKSVSMSRKEYWLTRYLLIINPELGEQVLGYRLKKDGTLYIMHVQIDENTVVAVSLSWGGGGWDSGLCPFDDGFDWDEGFILLSLPATAIVA